MKQIGIVDYGVGNISSLKNTLVSIGYKPIYTNSVDILAECSLIILPGVGSFSAAINNLKERKLDKFLANYALGGSILGICLGMQLLGTSSTENGNFSGLNLIPGDIEVLPEGIVHTGWNTVTFNSENSRLKPVKEKEFFFNHQYSYSMKCRYIIGKTTVKLGLETVSAVRKKNILGIQFHPEKSQEAGKRILKTIIVQMINA